MTELPTHDAVRDAADEDQPRPWDAGQLAVVMRRHHRLDGGMCGGDDYRCLGVWPCPVYELAEALLVERADRWQAGEQARRKPSAHAHDTAVDIAGNDVDDVGAGHLLGMGFGLDDILLGKLG